MRRVKIVLLAALLALAAVTVYVALRNPQAPPMPDDADHASFPSADPCLTCHGPDGPLPRSQSHPIGRDCLRCHGES